MSSQLSNKGTTQVRRNAGEGRHESTAVKGGWNSRGAGDSQMVGGGSEWLIKGRGGGGRGNLPQGGVGGNQKGWQGWGGWFLFFLKGLPGIGVPSW